MKRDTNPPQKKSNRYRQIGVAKAHITICRLHIPQNQTSHFLRTQLTRRPCNHKIRNIYATQTNNITDHNHHLQQ